MDLSISVWTFFQFVCYYLIAGFFLHLLAIKNADNNFGKGLSVLV